MVELLKQGQYAPMDVVDQVLSIYAGTRGHLDAVKREEVATWEKEFLTFVRDQVPELRSRIEKSKELDAEGERQLEAAIAEFKRQWATRDTGAKGKGKSRVIIVHCESGVRSTAAHALLTKQGFEKVFTLNGGIAAWKAASLPTEKA